MSRMPERLALLVSQANSIAWLVLLVFFALTGWVVHELNERESHLARERFELQVSEVESAVRSRMTAHEQILIGAAALFDASEDVDRHEWRTYVERLRLSRHYPGIQALAFTQVIPARQLADHVQKMRQEFPDYQLRPAGERALYTSIIFIEPFRDRNLAAFGYDMFSEPVRRQAMTAAVTENDTRISGRVTLVQENLGPVQPGFLMYLPVYHQGLPVDTLEQRWAALQGFVYSPYRMEDLMAGILGQRNLNVRFAIHTGAEDDDSQLLFSSHPQVIDDADEFFIQRQMPLYGQTWTLSFRSDSRAFPSYWQRLEQVAIALGVSTGLLLFLLISFLTNENARARNLAKGMTRDIHQTLDALRLSEERLRLALDSSAMGVWNWHLAENRIHWDDSIYPLFGLAQGERLHSYENFLALLHPDDRERVFNEVACALDGKLAYDTEYRVIWPDGSLHHMASRARVLLDDAQQPLMMTGTCWDITEKKRLEKMKSEFVSTISHELRTPLTSITGSLALMSSDKVAQGSDQYQQLLVMANNNAQRLKHLIDDLLDLEKLTQARMHFAFEVCALAPLVLQVLEENRLYAEQYQVSFRADIRLAVAEVSLDPARFLQVMANLLSNAAKFSHPGGEVLVSLLLNDQGGARVAIQDQGMGIADEAQPFIFNKFFQADASDKRQKGGTGLGLAIAKMMVEQMQGELSFYSRLGQGSCFYMDFPLLGEAVTRATDSPDSSSPRSPQTRD